MTPWLPPLRATALFIALACAARAEVALPYLIADRMVIQRGLPVHIWGRAEPGEAITVEFRGDTRRAATDLLGRFSVYLPPGAAGGPFSMVVSGTNTITLQDILVGDVWVAAGQSNMEWPIAWAGDARTELAQARYPRIRLVRATHKVSDYPMPDLNAELWRACTPESAATFSAVGYHFARLIQADQNVPIGIIQTAWGGTPLDAWTSLHAISADPQLMPVIAEWDAMMRQHAIDLLRYHREAKDWEKLIPTYKAQHKQLPPAPQKPVGPAGPWKPASLYNAMVAPITPMPIRGVIWYQGEANGSNKRAPYYGRLFEAMIRDWRAAWGIGDFPFLFVQLAAYNAPESSWPELREGQRSALALTNTAMVVTIDVGTPDNIHPPDKKTVGTRLSLAARALAYREQIEYSGPLPRQVTCEPASLRVWFDHAAGLTARGGDVRGFEIAGADRKYSPAEGRIEDGTVILRSGAVPEPIYVRYAFKDNPDGNLFNAAGLPASPFRHER
jgi:sialate O-acetylesterase